MRGTSPEATFTMRRGSLAALLLLLLLSGCAEEPLKVGIRSWIGYDVIPMARQWGWIGPEVELIPRESAAESLSGLASGELQAACLTLDEVIRGLDQGLSLTIVAVMNVSSGADSLLVRPGINSVADLRGARIALQTSGANMLMLTAALASGGLALSDIELVEATPADLPGLWEAGDIAAVATYEPHARALRNIGAVTLLSSRDTPELIFDVIAVRSDAVKTRKKALANLVSAILRAQSHVHDNPVDTVYRLASLRGNPVWVTEEELRHVVIPTLDRQHGYFDRDSPLSAAVGRINELFVNAGVTNSPQGNAGLLDPAYLPELPE